MVVFVRMKLTSTFYYSTLFKIYYILLIDFMIPQFVHLILYCDICDSGLKFNTWEVRTHNLGVGRGGLLESVCNFK